MAVASEKTFSKSRNNAQYGLKQEQSSIPRPRIRLPLTPPPGTDEQYGQSPDLPAIDRLLRALDAIRNPTIAKSFASWKQYHITQQQYDQLLKRLERDLRRFDFESATELLVVRMPSPVHDFFSTLLADDVHDWLKQVATGEGQSGTFASKILSGGSSRIILEEGDVEEHGAIRRQPDAQFQHQGTAYPGVVVEVSYSQDGKNLQKLAQDYILYSNGDIKAVVGIDINYGGKESTVSLWRPQYFRGADEEFEHIITKPDIVNKPFRSIDGHLINGKECVTIMLSDFATDEIPAGDKPITLSISLERLHDLLTKAEQIQRDREPADGQHGIKSKRKTQKRRLSSSPADRLESEDEASFLREESNAAQRSEAADEDFIQSAAKRGNVHTRRKLS